MKELLAVALGGAIGASLRYLTAIAAGTFLAGSFPWGTLLVNVIGSFLLGALVEYGALTGQLSRVWRNFLAVGVLGGYTTFSTFALDIFSLSERSSDQAALLYSFLTLFLTLGGMFCGFRLMRLWLG